MHATGFSFQGVRENNEDSYLLLDVSGGNMHIVFYNDDYVTEYDQETELPDFSLYAVSDGMGGMESGSEASYLTLSKLMESAGEIVLSSEPAKQIVTTIKTISERIGTNFDDRAGATLIGIISLGSGSYMFNTGDSLCTVWTDDGTIVNKRHTCLNEAQEKGIECKPGTEDYLTDNIGMSDVRVDVYELGDWDIALLSSDGLVPLLDKGNIRSELALGTETMCRKAMELGSEDNITAVIAVRD